MKGHDYKFEQQNWKTFCTTTEIEYIRKYIGELKNFNYAPNFWWLVKSLNYVRFIIWA